MVMPSSAALPPAHPRIVTANDITAVVGTVPYMAPEAASPAYDEKVDIFSAAVTFCASPAILHRRLH